MLDKYKSGKGHPGWAAVLLGRLTLGREHPNGQRVNFPTAARQIHPTSGSAVDGFGRLVPH